MNENHFELAKSYAERPLIFKNDKFNLNSTIIDLKPFEKERKFDSSYYMRSSGQKQGKEAKRCIINRKIEYYQPIKDAELIVNFDVMRSMLRMKLQSPKNQSYELSDSRDEHEMRDIVDKEAGNPRSSSVTYPTRYNSGIQRVSSLSRRISFNQSSSINSNSYEFDTKEKRKMVSSSSAGEFAQLDTSDHLDRTYVSYVKNSFDRSYSVILKRSSNDIISSERTSTPLRAHPQRTSTQHHTTRVRPPPPPPVKSVHLAASEHALNRTPRTLVEQQQQQQPQQQQQQRQRSASVKAPVVDHEKINPQMLIAKLKKIEAQRGSPMNVLMLDAKFSGVGVPNDAMPSSSSSDSKHNAAAAANQCAKANVVKMIRKSNRSRLDNIYKQQLKSARSSSSEMDDLTTAVVHDRRNRSFRNKILSESLHNNSSDDLGVNVAAKPIEPQIIHKQRAAAKQQSNKPLKYVENIIDDIPSSILAMSLVGHATNVEKLIFGDLKNFYTNRSEQLMSRFSWTWWIVLVFVVVVVVVC